MRNYGKIQRLITLFILNIIVFLLVALLSNFTHAQQNSDLHKNTLYEIRKYTPTQNAYIIVGSSPSAIGVNNLKNKIYVANLDDDTVSVIDGNNNTKIGKDIPVGKKPLAIGVNRFTNTIYVANT